MIGGCRQTGSADGLQLGPLLRQDRTLHRANLEADAAIDAGVEIDPVERRALAVGPLAGVDAGHRTGVDAIGHAFAHVGDDRVGHAADELLERILGRREGAPQDVTQS